MEISALYIYPVKSLAGIAMSTARLERAGLQYDRQWMVVEPDGTFMTQREYPQMALIETAIVDGQLQLQTFGMESLRVPPPAAAPQRLPTEVWGDNINAILCAEPAHEWLSAALGTPCRLVAFPGHEPRQCDPQYAHRGDSTGFADGYPLLVVSEASLDDLNQRLARPVGMDRFRPNIVIKGPDAFAEDQWSGFAINGIDIRMAKPCSRCAVPTIDQQRGLLDGPEPLATLATYRQRDGQIYFGMNAIPETSGELRLGDKVTVKNKQSPSGPC